MSFHTTRSTISPAFRKRQAATACRQQLLEIRVLSDSLVLRTFPFPSHWYDVSAKSLTLNSPMCTESLLTGCSAFLETIMLSGRKRYSFIFTHISFGKMSIKKSVPRNLRWEFRFHRCFSLNICVLQAVLEGCFQFSPSKTQVKGNDQIICSTCETDSWQSVDLRRWFLGRMVLFYVCYFSF